MRFHGEHISKILPSLFVESQENTGFAKSERGKKLQELFESNVDDRKFSAFYKALKNYNV